MLYGQQALGQRVRRILREHGNRTLRNDGSMIQHRRDEVYRTSMPLHADRQRLLMCMQAWKSR